MEWSEPPEGSSPRPKSHCLVCMQIQDGFPMAVVFAGLEYATWARDLAYSGQYTQRADKSRATSYRRINHVSWANSPDRNFRQGLIDLYPRLIVE